MHWSKGEPINIIKDYNELMLKEQSLRLKERELLKKEVLLQRKIKEFKKRGERRAKSDLSKAKDLQEARRKLLLVLDSKQKAQKCKKYNSKNKQKNIPSLRTRSVTKDKKDFNDILYDFCEKLLSSQCTKNNSCMRIFGTRFKPFSSRYQNMLRLNRNDCTRNIPYMERNSNPAENCYLMSLRKTPQMWIYRRWPKFYPHYLSCRKEWENVGYFMLFFLGFLFWAPILICFELVKCCFCACCCDC